jgi:pimeloyl-ACP methyl ester carboxylesterase
VTAFVLIPGAGGAAWYWHRVAELLAARGHSACAVELPADDPDAGLAAYAHAVLTAAPDAGEVVVVAQSLGGFTAPLVAGPLAARRVVLLNAMIPLPAETPGQWWDAVGSEDARLAAARAGGYSEDFDMHTYFLHDVAPDIVAAGEPHQKDQSPGPFGDPCLFDTWPAPVTVIAGRDDRFFPLALQQRVARERVGVEPVVVPGGHLAALSHPGEVVEVLVTD